MTPVRGPSANSLAVALKYEGRGAPRVVAKGRGEVGRRIIEAAREHGVPLEQDAGLAEVLSRIELDEEIPVELYIAVAEVMAFILRARAQAPALPRATPQAPAPEVYRSDGSTGPAAG